MKENKLFEYLADNGATIFAILVGIGFLILILTTLNQISSVSIDECYTTAMVPVRQECGISCSYVETTKGNEDTYQERCVYGKMMDGTTFDKRLYGK